MLELLRSSVLSHRSIHFPVNVRAPRLVQAVLAIARALEAGEAERARRLVADLARAPALREVEAEATHQGGSSTMRAQALARVLLDLATNGWEVSLEEGQIYLSAPQWSAGGEGLSPEAVQREKARARQSMAVRVQEQLEQPTTRRFIYEQEQAHFAAAGTGSILSLLADGPALAETLRRKGAAGIQPYLQVADVDQRDEFSGLRLNDIFRYFRYFWSFPYGSTPGRTTSVLIRDAGQPNHPVCGLLALTSPVPRLTARDSALGWSPAWLEAVVAALDFPPAAPGPHLALVEEALTVGQGEALGPGQVFEDLSLLLGLPRCSTARELTVALGGLSVAARRQRAVGVRKRLTEDLLEELEEALRAISFEGLGLTHKEALANPAQAQADLQAFAAEARENWRSSRELRHGGALAHRVGADALESAQELLGLSSAPLFLKKRAAQAANLLSAWHDIQRLTQERTPERLRELTLGHARPWPSGEPQLSGGETVTRGLRAALLQRQSRFVASQVVDVSVCGALPPYGPLLGGKLAALLALSGELAGLYHERYDGQVSEIGSQMAGRRVTKPTDLVALTTTSFYGVGSSQYSRVRLPVGADEVRWRFVGYSRGHGTMHFSRETSRLLQALLRLETGRQLISSSFGEGPSERLRKVRDGLVRLGLDADGLLLHGMPRQVFVAEVSVGETRPGIQTRGRPWRKAGPSAEAVAAFWRERWLGPRLARLPQLVEEVAAFSRSQVLLSRRLSPDTLLPPALGSGVLE